MSGSVVLQTELAGALPLIARGKVRDLYDVDDKILLFVATDRISAYDVILKNVQTSLPLWGKFSNYMIREFQIKEHS